MAARQGRTDHNGLSYVDEKSVPLELGNRPQLTLRDNQTTAENAFLVPGRRVLFSVLSVVVMVNTIRGKAVPEFDSQCSWK